MAKTNIGYSGSFWTISSPDGKTNVTLKVNPAYDSDSDKQREVEVKKVLNLGASNDTLVPVGMHSQTREIGKGSPLWVNRATRDLLIGLFEAQLTTGVTSGSPWVLVIPRIPYTGSDPAFKAMVFPWTFKRDMRNRGDSYKMEATFTYIP